jgi:carbon-monoxide dehydrogenase large subunit
MIAKIGDPVPRLEDRRLLRGRGNYTDDLAPRDALFAVLLRSPYAHASILGVDSTSAKAVPGVRAILTAADYTADGHHPIRHAANPPDALEPQSVSFVSSEGTRVLEWGQPPLAVGRVRYVGEAVVCVVAATLAAARDAAELIEVEYEELPAVVDLDEAVAAGAERLWPENGDNISLTASMGNAAAVKQALGAAHLVLERDFRNQRIVNCQMEPRSAFASHDDAEGYTVVTGSQGVVRQRAALAGALGVPPERVRMICPDVGGGFGPRTALSPEAVLVAWAARRLNCPVRWTSDRTEAFLSDYQARDQRTRLALAFDAEGRITAMHSRQYGNLGAYPVSFAPLANGQRIAPTCYAIPLALVETQGVLTNTVPTVPYRGAGRPEAHFAMERLLDIAAARLRLDRAEIRRRNLVPRAAMPYRTATGLTYDSGDLVANMEQALSLADREGFEDRRRETAARGRLRGFGFANYVEAPVGAARERVTVRILEDGGAEILSGTQSTGQGHETTFAQVVSALLGISMERVALRTGDTAFVTLGGGSHSNRSARLVGTLLHQACSTLVERGRHAAAVLLDAPLEAVEFRAGRFHRGQDSTSFKELQEAHRRGALPAQMVDNFVVTSEIGDRIPAHPTGCAVCEVEIDKETGQVFIVRYSSVDDVGQPLNRKIVDGQVHGGIVQGIGQALYEHFALEAESGQVLSGSFMDYRLTRAGDLPSFTVDLAEDPTTVPSNPLRVKGGGEGGITPATAAVINAVVDALAPYRIEHVEMPATPTRIWSLIQGAAASPAFMESDT